jgi:DNA-binding NarL/FixJ family response regulator
MKKNILIVDDHLVVRTGVSIILEEEFKDIIISTTDNYQETLLFIGNNKVDLVILDVNIIGGKNTAMIAEIKQLQPLTKILIFSMYEEETHACPYIIAGANGYLNKLSDKIQLITAVDSVLKNGKFLTQNTIELLINASTGKEHLNPLDVLSKREMEITMLLIQGHGNIEIAQKLNIHLTTVSTHKNKIFSKLNITNIVSLLAIYTKSAGLYK